MKTLREHLKWAEESDSPKEMQYRITLSILEEILNVRDLIEERKIK